MTEWILTWAVTLQLLDPREVRYADVGQVVQRWQSLAGAPLLGDGAWLPSRELCNGALSYNREVRRVAVGKMFWDTTLGGTFFADAVEECDVLYLWWDAARDYRCEYYYVPVRREALRKMRDAFPANWRAQVAPANVPIWRLSFDGR